MNATCRSWIAVVAGVLGLLSSGRAFGAVSLCVTTRTESTEQAGLEKLVRSEVERHPSHRIVDKDCESRLIVETFEASGTRYLTVQLDGEVPERATVSQPEALAGKLSQSIALVLGNDPVSLAQDPTRYRAMERVAHTVLVRGTNNYRLELFETAMRMDNNVAFAPGAAFGFARGAEHWRIHARLHVAGWPQQISGNERALRLCSGMDAGVLYDVSKRANTSGYFGAGAGVALLRVEGLVDSSDRSTATVVDRLGGTLNLRAGIRFLRIFEFDADVFSQFNFPLFTTRETDDPLWGDNGVYTPYLQLGVGIGF